MLGELSNLILRAHASLNFVSLDNRCGYFNIWLCGSTPQHLAVLQHTPTSGYAPVTGIIHFLNFMCLKHSWSSELQQGSLTGLRRHVGTSKEEHFEVAVWTFHLHILEQKLQYSHLLIFNGMQRRCWRTVIITDHQGFSS